jgi:hypothetical protein
MSACKLQVDTCGEIYEELTLNQNPERMTLFLSECVGSQVLPLPLPNFLLGQNAFTV